MDLSESVEKLYGSKLRLRVCGLCLQDNKLLMVRHKGLGKQNEFWAPPGGGMDFSLSATDNLKKEFLEETGLYVTVEELLFVHEFLAPPLHAVELFFLVKPSGGRLKTGTDPEMAPEEQLIEEVRFMHWAEIKEKAAASLHQIFWHRSSLKDLLSMRGYYNFRV